MVPAKDAAERSRIAREAALHRWAKEDPKAAAIRAQEGLRRKYYEQTDPSLPEAERQRRAECLYKAHFVRMRRIAAKNLLASS